jgi:hypothetical protein
LRSEVVLEEQVLVEAMKGMSCEEQRAAAETKIPTVHAVAMTTRFERTY